MAFPAEMQDTLDACHGVFARTVTLRKVTPGAMNAATMTRAETTQDYTVTAVRELKTQQDGAGGGLKSEAMFAVRASELGAVGDDLAAVAEPVNGWRIIDAGAAGGSETWAVSRVRRSADGLAFELYCRTLRKS